MKYLSKVTVAIGLIGFLGYASNAGAQPNILYIVADDLGYTDIGSFGSEIPTPNLDALAFNGTRLTNFHTDRSCQPTRMMLMASAGTGAALQYIGDRTTGRRGNVLRREWAILPELLQDAGYATYMAGKWDLGAGEGFTPATRGFDRSFVILDASASHFAEVFWEDPQPFEDDGVPMAIDQLPPDFYATKDFTDKMIEFLKSNDGETPWFAYVPYTAPHWPLQLPEDWLDRHAGRYDSGYDVLREERMARAQEIYAGMVEYLDMSVGRLIDYLEESGQFDNTIVIFSSDHGGSSNDVGLVESVPPARISPRDNRYENLGRPGSYIDRGLGFGEDIKPSNRLLPEATE